MESNSLVLLQILLGVALLVAGHRLFWMFIGLVGFVVGFQLTPYLIQDIPERQMYITAIILGLLGVFLAITVQKLMVKVGAFFVAGMLAEYLMGNIVVPWSSYPWVTFVGGGLIGVLFSAVFVRWAITVFSVVLGTMFIIEPLPVNERFQMLVFYILIVMGILIQRVQPEHNVRLKSNKEDEE